MPGDCQATARRLPALDGSLQLSCCAHLPDRTQSAIFLHPKRASAPMSDTGRPFLVVTAICDASARPAAITVGHGDAMERACLAADSAAGDGIDLVELPISPQAFAALRRHLQIEDARVTVYDLFPLSAALDPRYRTVAGQ